MKNLIKKFKKKMSSNSGYGEPQYQSEKDAQKGIISDYLGQDKLVLEKEESAKVRHSHMFEFLDTYKRMKTEKRFF